MPDNTRTVFTSADYADTGQWRLIVEIRETGLRAWLKNILHPETPPEKLVDAAWDSHGEPFIKDIENAVYDNPRILDDFSADIIISTDKVLWIPADKEFEGREEELFARVWPGEEDEILMDDNDGTLAVYTLTRGLRGFLNRTFPGARVSCAQSVLYNSFMREAGEGVSLFVNLREGGMDMIGFRAKGLLLSASYRCEDAESRTYYIVNALDAYNITPSEGRIYITGEKEDRRRLTEIIRKLSMFVTPLHLPGTKEDRELPTAACFCATKKISYPK